MQSYESEIESFIHLSSHSERQCSLVGWLIVKIKSSFTFLHGRTGAEDQSSCESRTAVKLWNAAKSRARVNPRVAGKNA